MLISDIMKTNVVSISSSTSLAEARRIMDAHNIRRLPVIDRMKLVGIVTKDDLDKMGPSQLTTFRVNELVYMLNKITVKDVMHKDVVTVPPETTIEEAVAIAQARKIQDGANAGRVGCDPLPGRGRGAQRYVHLAWKILAQNKI